MTLSSFRRRSMQGLLLAILAAALTATTLSARAQGAEQDQLSEQIQAHVGDTVELLGIAANRSEQFSWILTQNGKFLEAGRLPVFHVRLTEPGTYLLEAGVLDPQSSTLIRKNITLIIVSHDVALPQPPVGTATDLVATVPAAQGGNIALPQNSQLILLAPNATANPLNLDGDTTVDSDGNGNPQDDMDDQGSLFSQGANPLYVWYVQPQAEHTMRVWTNDNREQTFTVNGPASPAPAPSGSGDLVGTSSASSAATETGTTVTVSQGPIVATNGANGAVTFSFPSAGNFDPTRTLVQWDFGDSTQSLQTQATHTYQKPGTYQVTVLVRDISSGQPVAQGHATVTIAAVPAATTGSSSSQSSATAPAGNASSPSSKAGGSFVSAGVLSAVTFVGGIALVLIVVILLIALLVWLVRKFLHSESRLQRTLEKAEGRIMKGSPASIIDVPPPPMEIKRQTPPPAPAEPEPAPPAPPEEPAAAAPAAGPTPPPTDFVNVDEAPSWLRKGLDSSVTGAAAPETPAPENPEPATASVPPASEPPATSTVTQPEPEPPAIPTPLAPEQPETSTPLQPSPSSDEEMLPPWLREPPGQADTSASESDDSASASPSIPAAAEPATAPEPMTADTPPSPPTPAPSSPAPAPSQEPAQEQATATPSSAPASQMTSAPQTSATLPAPQAPSPEDEARKEREREKKRQKRQRYKANLRKRTQTQQTAVPASAPAVTSQASAASVVPPPSTPAPETEEQVPPPASQETPAEGPTPASSPVDTTPDEKNGTNSSAPAAGTLPADASMDSIMQKAAQTPANNAKAPADAQPQEDSVAFLISADSVSGQQKPEDQGKKDA